MRRPIARKERKYSITQGKAVGNWVAREGSAVGSLTYSQGLWMLSSLGTPDRPELDVGAIATGDVRVLNEEVVGGLGIPRN